MDKEEILMMFSEIWNAKLIRSKIEKFFIWKPIMAFILNLRSKPWKFLLN